MARAVASQTLAVLVATGATLSVAGCKTMDIQKAMRDSGFPIAGAVLGGVSCNRLFEGKNRTMATAICAGGGAWLGAKLRDHLREREQAQLAEATYKTLDTGQKQTVRTDEGTTITTEMVKTADASTSRSTAQTSPQPTAGTAAKDCGIVKQTIVTGSNQRYEDDVKACKEGGAWVVT